MIAFLIVLLLVLYFLERWSLEHGTDGVSAESAVDRALAEPDEPFLWTVTVRNGKRWMVPYVKVRGSAPDGLLIAEGENLKEFVPADRENTMYAAYLAGRQEMAVTRTAALPRRGRYFFHGATVECGDFLGLESRTETFSGQREIVVKPRPLPSGKLKETLGGYLGETAVRKSLFEDPMLTAGFYDYTGREPLRSVSWNQSAKRGSLMVKRYESTADPSCSVLLNIGSGRVERDREREDLLELCFSMTRSVCEELERRKISYSFATNGEIAGVMGSWNRIEDGLGFSHLSAVLEGLGRMTYNCRWDFSRLLSRVLKGVRAGRSFLIVTPDRNGVSPELLKKLEEASGMRALVLAADELKR